MRKILLVILSIVLILSLCFLLGLFSLMPDIQTVSYSKTDLVFSNYDETLYFKKENRGNEKIVILSVSSNKEFEVDTSSEFIYDISSIPLFYKKTGESLIIYTMTPSQIPTNFKSRIKILQVEIDNPKMMKLINNKSYLNFGLKKIE